MFFVIPPVIHLLFVPQHGIFSVLDTDVLDICGPAGGSYRQRRVGTACKTRYGRHRCDNFLVCCYVSLLKEATVRYKYNLKQGIFKHVLKV